MLDVEQKNDIGGAQGSASCVVAEGMQQQELLPYFHPWDVADSVHSERVLDIDARVSCLWCLVLQSHCALISLTCGQ